MASAARWRWLIVWAIGHVIYPQKKTPRTTFLRSLTDQATSAIAAMLPGKGSVYTGPRI